MWPNAQETADLVTSTEKFRVCASLFVEAIPSSGNLYLVWDMAPIEVKEQSISWSIYTWPLSTVIKDNFLKIFVYQHETFAYSEHK